MEWRWARRAKEITCRMGLTVLLDTNAIIALLRNDEALTSLIVASDKVYISIINIIEFKSFSNLSAADSRLFDAFVKRIDVIDLTLSNRKLINQITTIRKQYKLKLPDAVIAASAMSINAKLVTADSDFSKVSKLDVQLI